MTAQPSIWVIILNWNGLDDTLACLASLRAVATGPYRVQTLVIDSNSALDPRPAIMANYPEVEVLRLKRNMGFTVPQSLIRHKVSASIGRATGEGRASALAYYLSMRNRIVIIVRYGTLAQRLCFLLIANPLRVLSYLGTFTLRRSWKHLAWSCLGLVHGLEGRLGGGPG